MSLRALALVAALLTTPSFGADLDAVTLATCADLDRALARDSEAIAAFNDASQRATDALHAGRTAEGCPALRQALGFASRAAVGLATCGDQVRDGPALLTGFRDLARQIEGVGRRAGCSGDAPGS